MNTEPRQKRAQAKSLKALKKMADHRLEKLVKARTRLQYARRCWDEMMQAESRFRQMQIPSNREALIKARLKLEKSLQP